MHGQQNLKNHEQQFVKIILHLFYNFFLNSVLKPDLNIVLQTALPIQVLTEINYL
jgi:hypothetical protein